MGYVEVDGLALYYDRYGFGPPVVLLHGFTGSRTSWTDFVREINSEFCTLSFDLIGHGRSGSPAEKARYQMDQAVDDLVAAVKTIGFDKAVWVGYSLGGRTALQVWNRHPEVVSALVVEGASPGIQDNLERRSRVESDEHLATEILERGMEWFVEYWEALPLWHSQNQTLSASMKTAIRAQRMAQREIGLANSLVGMGTGAQSWIGDDLQAITVPTLLVTGERDKKFIDISHEMATRISSAVRVDIGLAGHAAHVENPVEFNSVVREFLLRHREQL